MLARLVAGLNAMRRLCYTSLFSKGYVNDEKEKVAIKNFGGKIFSDREGHLCFEQPCPAYNGSCSIYPNHPLSCQGFACILLKQLRRDEITYEKAINITKQLQSAVDKIDTTLFPLLGRRTMSTVNHMRRFFEILESMDPEERSLSKKKYKDTFVAHTMFMFLRQKYFDLPCP